MGMTERVYLESQPGVPYLLICHPLSWTTSLSVTKLMLSIQAMEECKVLRWIHTAFLKQGSSCLRILMQHSATSLTAERWLRKQHIGSTNPDQRCDPGKEK